MNSPHSEWCDVAFGCVAQEKGLRLVGVKGLYGNGVIDSEMQLDEEEEGKVVALRGVRNHEAPLTIHNIKDAVHMRRVYEQSLQEREEQGEQQEQQERYIYSADGA